MRAQRWLVRDQRVPEGAVYAGIRIIEGFGSAFAYLAECERP